MKIAIFYHCLFFLGGKLLDDSLKIVHEQTSAVRDSGLEEAADEIHVGINGEAESLVYARMLLPAKAKLAWHGLESRSENRTLVLLEEWLPSHPGWLVLYFHAKGSTHVPGSPYAQQAGRWRNCMMRHCIQEWRTCVKDLEEVESVGCYWMTGLGPDKSQNIWGGNFWWARSDYLQTLPSIFERDRIKQSGIGSLESRYEAEVWIGNGKRLPTVKDYHLNGLGTCP